MITVALAAALAMARSDAPCPPWTPSTRWIDYYGIPGGSSAIYLSRSGCAVVNADYAVVDSCIRSDGSSFNAAYSGGAGSFFGVSDDGTSALGSINLSGIKPAVCIAQGHWEQLPLAGPGLAATALLMTSDGHTVVGAHHVSGGMWLWDRAAVWNRVDGTVTILPKPSSSEYKATRATGMTPDGQWAVGYSIQIGNNAPSEACLWNLQTGTLTLLPHYSTSPRSRAFGISATGDVVGHSTRADASWLAVKWSGGVPSVLPTDPNFPESIAWGISDDGRVIVGESRSSSTSRAFIIIDGQFYDLQEFFVSQGLPAWSVRSARAISADGRTMLAWDGEAMILVQIPPYLPSADIDGDGAIGGTDLGILLASWGECNPCAADLNRDGTVDGTDLGMLLAKWNS